MKILSVNTYSGSQIGGGTERTMEAIAGALQARGHEISILGTAEEQGLKRETRAGLPRWEFGIRNIYWPKPDQSQPGWKRKIWHLLDIYNSAMRGHLNFLLGIERPDLVMFHNLTGWSISAMDAVSSRNIPIVHILHDYNNICPNNMMFRNGRNCVSQCRECWVMRVPHRVLTNKAAAVVGVSQYILDRHLAHGTFGKVPIRRIIYNVRSAETLRLDQAPQMRAKAMAERENVNIRFGFIGAVSQNKGVELLIKAFLALNDPRAELWIAGTGKPEYIAYLIRSFPSPTIKFLGQTRQLEFFTMIDVTVVPSIWQEPLGMVVSESFAFGIPVICSRRGGIPEMGLHQGAGILFEPDEPGALSAAMQSCVSDRKSVELMSKLALVQSARFLDVEKWADDYEEVLEKCLQRAPK